MSYRYDDSYPFMHLAQRHGADYGDVLNYAEMHDFGRCSRIMNPTRFTQAQKNAKDALSEIVKHEIHMLCDLPVMHRGGRHETED